MRLMGSLQFSKIVTVLVFAVLLMILLNSCTLFNRNYAWDKHVDTLCAEVTDVENTLANVNPDTVRGGNTDALVEALQGIPDVSQVTVSSSHSLEYRLQDGTVGYVVLEELNDTDENTGNGNSLSGGEVSSNYLSARTGQTFQKDTEPTCPPWKSRKALVALSGLWFSRSLAKPGWEAATSILENSGYEVTSLLGKEFTPDIVYEFPEYGVILLMGEGTPNGFQTGLRFNSTNLNFYQEEDEAGLIFPLHVYFVFGKRIRVATYIGFYSTMVPKGLLDPLVYLNGCSTIPEACTKDDAWYRQLRNAGASVVLGNRDRIRPQAAGAALQVFCRSFFQDKDLLRDAVSKAQEEADCLDMVEGNPYLKHNMWPSAIITADPISGIAPLEVHFDASDSHDPDGDSLTYQWFFGDGAKATGKTATHTYEQGGDYEVTLFATDPCEHEAKATTTIHVEQNPCETETEPPVVTLNCPSSTSVGNAAFSWSATDNCSSEEDITFRYRIDNEPWSSWAHTKSKTYSNLTAGSHTFCVKAKDKLGNESDAKCCQVDVNPCLSDTIPPSVSLDCPQGVSSGDVTFTWHGEDNCSPQSALQYQYLLVVHELWSPWTTATSKTYTGLSSGSHRFCVRAKDAKGNVSEEVCCTFEVDQCLNDSTPPSITLNCGTPSGSGDVDFSWSASDNCAYVSRIEYRHRLTEYENWSNWGDLKEAHYHGLQPGVYTFCVQSRDPNGNTSEKCCPITVHECTNNPQIWTDKDTYCIGDPITIYMRFTSSCTASLLDAKQGSYTKYLFQNKSYEEGTYTINGKVDGPAGSETLTLSATACGSSPSDSVTISVEDCGGNVSQGETTFYGTVLDEPVIYGVKKWIVRVEQIASGVDIRPLGQVSVVMGVYPGCLGQEIGNIQPGDGVWVHGYFDGSSVDLCPSYLYYISNSVVPT